MLDVDSKDISAGVSSPPLAFIEKQFLTNSKLLLKDFGIYVHNDHYQNVTASQYHYGMSLLLLIIGLFVTNLAARNREKRTEILRCLSDTFPNLVSIPVPEDINEVIVAVPSATITKNGQQTGSDCEAKFELNSASNQQIKERLINLTSIISKNSVNTENLL